MLSRYLRRTDTAFMLSRYLRRTDTAFMLSPYLRRTDTASMLSRYLRRSDTAILVAPYLRRSDTTQMLSGYLRSGNLPNISGKMNYTDTLNMLLGYLRKADTSQMLSGYLRSGNLPNISGKMNYTDTLNMLLGYLRKADTSQMLSGYLRSGNLPNISGKMNYTDTLNMLLGYLRKADTSQMLSGYLRTGNLPNISGKMNYTDTLNMLLGYLRKADTSQMLSGYLRSGNLPNISEKMNYTDTLNMLLGYLRKADTSQMLSGYLRSGNLPNISGKMNYTDTLNMLLGYLRKADTSQMLSGYARTGNIPLVNSKVNYTDTLAMLLPYLRKTDTTTMLNRYLRRSDTASLVRPYLRKTDTTTMLSRYLRRSDTASLVLPYLRKTDTAFMMSRYLRRTDTAFMLLPYLRKIDTASMLTRYLRRSDTAILVAPYLRRSDTSQMLSGYVRSGNLPNIAGKMNYTDSANMLMNYLRKSDTSNLVAPYLRRSDTANMLKNYVNIANLTAAIAANTQVPDLQQVLGKGNVSSFSATIGSLTTSSPTLLLNNGADTAASLSFVRSLTGDKLSGSGTAGFMPIYNSNSSFSNSLISQQNAGAWNNRKIHFANNSSTTDYLFYTPSLINQYGYPTGLVITGDYSGYNNTVHFNQMTDLGAGWTSQFAFTPFDGNGSGYRTALYIRGNGIEATESVSITGANTFWNSSKPATLNLNSGNVNWNFNTTSGSGTWLDIRESSSVRLRIMSGGRLLLNTTTDNGVDRLQVEGSGRFVNNLTANAFVKSGGTASQYLMADGSVSTLPSFLGGSGTIDFIPKFTSNNAIGNSQIFDNGSNIGIGTINPISTLHVSGTMRQVFGSGQAGDGIFGAINGVSNGYRITNDASNNLTHTFHTGSNTAALHIASTGNIGIGTTSPANKFVVSNAGASGFEIDPAGGVNSGVLLQAYNRSTSAYMPQSYYALSHTFNVGSAGSARAFDISSSGNVGIGTASPENKLDLFTTNRTSLTSLGSGINVNYNGSNTDEFATIGFSWASSIGNNSTLWGMGMVGTNYAAGSAALNFFTAGNERMRITSGGNALIGTTTDNGVDRLQVNGSGRFVNNLTANAFVKLGGTASQYLMADGSVSTLPSFMGGFGTTNYLPKFTSANGIGNSQIFDNGGNIGIGTMSPDYKLDVRGNLFLGGLENRFLRINSSTNYYYDLQSTNDDFQIIEAGVTPRLTIKYPNGNVGIGTSSPAVKLDVSGQLRANGFGVNATPVSVGTSPNFIRFLSSGADFYLGTEGSSGGAFFPGANAYDNIFYSNGAYNFINGSLSRLYINSSGNIGVGSTSPNSRLDIDKASQISGSSTPSGALLIANRTAGNGVMELGTNSNAVSWIQSRNSTSATFYPLALNPTAGNTLIGTTTDNGVDRLQVNGSGRFVNNLTANAFVKSGGTASQYLMADGSVSTLPSFMGGSGTTNYLPKFTSANGIGNSQIIDNGTNVLVGTNATGATGIGINPSYNYSVAEGSGNSYFNLFRQANSAATVIANGYKYSSTANGFASSTSNPWGRSAIALGYGTGVISFFADGISTVANGTNITPSERMRITPTGNVGIGETNPSGRLEVRSATGHVGINTGTSVSPERGNLYYSTDGTGWKFNIGKLQSGTFTPQMTFQDNGNVGIGTSNPSGQFETYTDGYRRLAVSYPSSSETRLSLGANAFINQHANNEELSINQQYGSGKITFYTGYPNSEKMRITASGNIGIGTVNPQANLSIKSGSNVDAEINSLPEGIDIQSFNRTSNTYGYISFKTNAGNESMRILNTGQICVGCLVPGTYKMAVDGAMAARSLRITQTAGWADYVFDKKYNLRPLDEVEKFIQENQHLPDLPSATTVAREGIDVADMQAKLLSKIEELTLYVIELKKEVETLKKKQSKKSSSKK
jgi:hypothetical protein